MKTTIRILLLACALAVLFTNCEKEEETVETIPDTNFLNALISRGVDKNGDNMIDASEAEAMIYLDVSSCGIVDMTGIELFVNLVDLNCSDNQMRVLDVTHNKALERLISIDGNLGRIDATNLTNLRYLNCEQNQMGTLLVEGCNSLEILRCFRNNIRELDISSSTQLIELNCGSNQLTSLDVSNNTALESLYCSANQITTLDISNNTILERIQCSSSQLSSLDVSNNTALKELICGSNQLTTLDVTNNQALEVLSCYYNQLTTLDVTHNTALHYLFCSSNQLTSLDISNNTNLGNGYPGYTSLALELMPDLQEVCVWTMPFPPEGLIISTDRSPNIYFTTECSQ